MELRNTKFQVNGIAIPCIAIEMPHSRANAVVIHGYGGNKEEVLGLSYAISCLDVNAYTIDLRGHGENAEPYDATVLSDLNQVIHSLASQAVVVALGHSLGGRLALLSEADIRIGISPALKSSFSDQTVSTIKALRGFRVKQLSEDVNFEILKNLPLAEDNLRDSDLVLYGLRDIPDIISACIELKGCFPNTVEIPGASHNDIVTFYETFERVREFIRARVDKVAPKRMAATDSGAARHD
ncbi:MAG TPA: alpha/beta hydrolase [Bacteroidota bacterium]|nr:alpha/beta hydrolase [Bacteroidota bacterium]